MKFTALVRDINTKLAGETLSYGQLRVFLDSAIDEINARLNTKFPVFSELVDTDEYIAIPDKYLRTVIIPAAAFKYFVTDEEGSVAAIKYEEDFLKNLFYMERDFISQVPEAYRADDLQGTIAYTNQEDRGLFVDGSCFFL